MGIPDLSKFNDEDLRAFLDSFDTILTDCDGVIWMLGVPLDGAVDAVAALEALGKRIFYVTNNATRTLASYVSTLTALGYNVTESQVVTPAVTVAQLLRDRGVDRKVHLFASEAFRQEMLAAGIRCTEPRVPSALTLEAMKKHLRELDADVGAVVFDFTIALNYINLMEATKLLERPDCLFIVGATDRDLPLEPNFILLGPGYFVDILEKFTRRQPLKAGKPSPAIQEVVAARHPSFNPSRTLFIGDSLPQDIGQGILSGFKTLLVLSGISTLEEAENAPPEQQPQFVAPSLKALVTSLRRLVAASSQQDN